MLNGQYNDFLKIQLNQQHSFLTQDVVYIIKTLNMWSLAWNKCWYTVVVISKGKCLVTNETREKKCLRIDQLKRCGGNVCEKGIDLNMKRMWTYNLTLIIEWNQNTTWPVPFINIKIIENQNLCMTILI